MFMRYNPSLRHRQKLWRGASKRSRDVLSGVALSLTAALLASCAQDQATKPSSLSAPTNPEFVVAGANEYNLIDNATLTVNGAVWNQSAPFQVGTGNLNPFLRVQDNPNEEGFNTNAKPAPLDADASWTKALSLNQIPVVSKSGTAYREFILDANEANSPPDAYFSVDLFSVWLCVDAAAADFTTESQFTGGDGGKCKLVYQIDDGTKNRVLATDDLSSGSGNGYDYQILIPNQKFIDAASLITGFQIANCGYQGAGATPCGAYIIVDTKLGFKGGDYITGATFEEVSTVKRPWVAVTKTATPSFKRRYLWQITKSVNPTSITQFDGQSQDATWTINVTPQNPAFTDFDATVSGTITVSNTSGAAVTLGSISDAIGDGYPAVTLVCPSGTTNVPLANNSTYVCTYSVVPPNTTAGAHTNTATVTVPSGVAGEDPAVFTGTATFNFATATPSQEIDKNPNVYDNYNSEGELLKGTASQAPFQYTKSYPCGSSRTVSNTARVDLTAPTADLTATATLTINCLTLTVTKTAATSVNRTFNWLISKSVTPASWNLFNGDQGISDYTVTASPNGFTDAGLTVTGDITIHNPNSVSVYLQALPTDVLTGPLTATVTCPKVGAPTVFPFTLTAGSDLVCSYTRSLPDNTNRTNTATVTAKPTPAGTSKDFSGTASVTPGTATATETNRTVNVTDNFNATGAVALGTATWGTGITPAAPTVLHPQSRTFSCPTAQASYVNVATITQTGQTAQATVNVTCRDLTVTKTAAPKYRRKWTWGVAKTINPTSTSLTLDIGQSYAVGYTVVYTSTPAEDNFRVGGTIAVSNPAGGSSPMSTAIINSVSDAVSGIVNPATVTCTGITFPYSLVAGATLNCTYADLSLPNKDTRTNTATAVRQNRSFSSALVASNLGSTTSRTGTASVTFGATPTEALDECVNVSDTNPGTTVTGKKCAGDASKTFTYSKTLLYQTCGDFTVPNTASFTSTPGTTGSVTNTATPLTGSASVTINVHVACPQGCTLTLGYWKTHNATFKGGAPLDDTWDILGLKELTGFFTTWSPSYAFNGPNTAADFNWFNVFWTPPKGNAYYQLAHQYMAAKLNYLNNAGQTATVTATIGSAENFFKAAGNTPAGWATNGLTPTPKSDLISWAGILGAYNEGTAPGGPQHCSEDNTSSR